MVDRTLLAEVLKTENLRQQQQKLKPGRSAITSYVRMGQEPMQVNRAVNMWQKR